MSAQRLPADAARDNRFLPRQAASGSRSTLRSSKYATASNRRHGSRRARPSPASRSARRIGHRDCASANPQQLKAPCFAPFCFLAWFSCLVFSLACVWSAQTRVILIPRGTSSSRSRRAHIAQACRRRPINYTVFCRRSIQPNSATFRLRCGGNRTQKSGFGHHTARRLQQSGCVKRARAITRALGRVGSRQ
jgi:hypothetical protein